MNIAVLTAILLLSLIRHSVARQVNISVSTSKILGDLPPVARFFGCDEPNYATYPDGRALLADLGNLGPRQTYFRTHNLLTTCDPPTDTTPHRLKWGCTNAYTEEADGRPIYNFTITDLIFDAYLENGVKPYAQTGFMPKALSTHPDPYSFDFDGGASANNIFTGWSNPPTSWQKWGDLIYEWVKHCVERYGAKTGNARWLLSAVKPKSALVQVPPLQKTWYSQLPRTSRLRSELGIICPCQAREAIPQPAGLAELVFGDQEAASVRAVGRALRNAQSVGSQITGTAEGQRPTQIGS
jgi:hypothetical protein